MMSVSCRTWFELTEPPGKLLTAETLFLELLGTSLELKTICQVWSISCGCEPDRAPFGNGCEPEFPEPSAADSSTT